MITILAPALFIVAYAAIALETRLHINKSAIALAAGAGLWILVVISGFAGVEHELSETILEIFNITIFLMSAMALVEIIAHYRIFEVLQAKIFEQRPTDRMQFITITALTFIFSALLDNLTTTIIMVQIARKFFKDKNLLIAIVGIVISANAGGAFSPIGDVTTIMLWFAGKFEASEVIVYGILPSLALYLVMLWIMLPTIRESGFDLTPEPVELLARSEKLVIFVAGASFTLPILVKLFHLPPVLGLLFGLGVSWMLMDFFRRRRSCRTHLEATTEKLMSAAGVVAMGMVKELTFEKYFKIGFVPALVSYIACLGVWWLQYVIV